MLDSLTASDCAQHLTLHWEDGDIRQLSAVTLRREAKDAWTRREQIDTGDVVVMPGIQITGLYAVGAGGVNVHFSDGHDKAIYPFVYLRDLCDRFDN